MSVKPAGRPVAASWRARRSYDETARLLNFGCAGRAAATIARPATTPKICLIEGIVCCCLSDSDIGEGDVDV